MGPAGTVPVLQVHPSRRCNLRCLHCYSSSGPDERESLDVGILCRAIADARAEGYLAVSMSGGEPLLYEELGAVLAQARACGMSTALVSNGMLLDERRVARLAGALDLLAISLDGLPAAHNRMRGSDRAFEAMAGRLPGLRRSGIPYGFIFTLTQNNLDELEWVVDFALEQGASLVQVHPLEDVGRARVALTGARPDAVEVAYGYLEVARLQAHAGSRLTIQFDVVHRDGLRRDPERVYADASSGSAGVDDRTLAELVAPLVIEPDGTVVPLEYGFGRQYAIGNLHAGTLPDLARAWRRTGYPAFRQLCRRVFIDLTAPTELPFVNWYEEVGAAAEVPACP